LIFRDLLNAGPVFAGGRGKKFFSSVSVESIELGSSPCKYRLLSDDIKVILLYHKSKKKSFFFSFGRIYSSQSKNQFKKTLLG